MTKGKLTCCLELFLGEEAKEEVGEEVVNWKKVMASVATSALMAASNATGEFNINQTIWENIL